MKHSVHKLLLLRWSWKIVMAGLVLPFGAPTKAEVTLDGSLGPTGSIPLVKQNFQIPDTVGKMVGTNLFHSFGLFNINTGQSATFTGPSSIENVLGRVTGGSPSFIDGLLRTKFENASPNLFLLNPAGVVFGPNASLDVQGSFHVSTADYLKLGNRGQFDATHPENSVLTTAPPKAFGFLGNKQPAGIRFEDSNLTLDKTLSVIGGDIAITGESLLDVTNGNIHLVSTASGGEVTMSHAGVEAPSFSRMGKIEMIGSDPSSRSGIQIHGERPGRILILGGQLVMEKALIRYDGSDGDPTKNSQAIDIKLTDTMQLRTGGKIELTGQGHGLNVKTGRLEVRNGAAISVRNESRTTPSTIQVEAKDVVVEGVTDDHQEISGSEIKLSGKGNIAVNTDRLEASNGGRIITSRGASISVNAKSITLEGVKRGQRSGLIANPPEDVEGTGGDITIKTDRLEVKRGARISTSTNLFSTGSSGNLQIEANDILVDGVVGNDKSSIIAEAQANSPTSGRGGDLKINTKNLTVSNGATISARTLGPGPGGNVFIQATNIELQNQGTISARSESKENNAGKSGNLTLTASDSLQLSGDSQITVETTQADAGNITLSIGKLLYLHDKSAITTSVADGKGNGGNIAIGSVFVVLDEGSSIIANALKGQGGNILIRILDGGALFQSPDSRIEASSEFGIDGSVVIDAPDTDIIAGFAGLPANFLDAATVLTQLCAERSGANVSSLVVRKYEVLPDSPYALRVQLPPAMPPSGTAKQSRAPRTYYAGNPLRPMISCLGHVLTQWRT